MALHGNQKYNPETILAALNKFGTASQAFKNTGIPQHLFYSYCTPEQRLEAKRNVQDKNKTPAFEAAPLPSKRGPLEDLLSVKRKNFEQYAKRKNAENWRKHKIKIEGPVGILWFGDPHLDDDGCNFPLLERDLQLARETPGVLPANLGDTLNNWVGRLERLYAAQSASAEDAMEMYEWFINAAPWWLWLFGNHCLWPTANTNLMKRIAAESGAVTADWQSRLELTFPNGRKSKIWAAHNFAGHSQWNPLHGPMKRASFGGGEADLYIAGDKHNWALFHNEDDQSHRTYWAARARGYKFMDTYAELLGFGSQSYGAAIMSVYDPSKQGPGFLTCFADAEEGADYLKFKRKKAGV